MGMPVSNSFRTLSKKFEYNRAETLVENIRAYIETVKAASLLDIGAGTPNMAAQLSRIVERYVAVEENNAMAKLLLRGGLNTLCGTFPMCIGETFDLVLSCHSVPEASLDLYPAFLDSVWQLVNDGGILLVITFKGSKGDSSRLREELTGSTFGADPQFGSIVQNLSRRGCVQIEEINSYIKSPHASDIITFISETVFRTNREKLDHLDRLNEILHRRYVVDGQYVFPLQHLFLSVRRNSNCKVR
jgi:ubiquinone/menaquinone biosynthesis C-methylase UbiE